MSSFGVVEHKNYSLRVPPGSRLIPGKQSGESTPRKKAQSVSFDRQYWNGSPGEQERVAIDENVFTVLAESVLPRPATDVERPQVVLRVAADLFLLTISLSFLNFFSQRNLGSSFAGTLLLYGSLLTLLGHSEGLYSARFKAEETVVLGKTIAWATILLAAIVRLTNWNALPPDSLVAIAPLNYFGMLAWRKAARLHGRAQTHAVRNVLIVGAGPSGARLARYIDQHHPGGRFFRGFLEDSDADIPDVRGRISDLPRIARAHFVDEVIVAIPQQRELAQQVIRDARRNHLDIRVVPDLLGYEPEEGGFENLGAVPVVTLHSEMAPTIKLFLKRVIDCVVAGTALLLCAPVMAAIALAIKLDSSGPVLFCAPRMGKKGMQFRCCKFRTMAVDAQKRKEELRANNQREGPFFKIAHDPRLTPLGGFLRRYSLDELPQLWNVLVGQMSLVGPRPHPIDDFSRYRLEDFRRLDVTPGITGLWQITARRDPSFERNMALDLQYIEQWSLWLDMKILWKTLSVVVQGTGA